MSFKSWDDFFSHMQRSDFLHRLLRSALSPYRLEARYYCEVESTIPRRDLVVQLYNLERQFPSSLAFFDGLGSRILEESNLELMRGIERDRKDSTVIVAEFELNEIGGGIFRRLTGRGHAPTASILVGYNEVSEVDGRIFGLEQNRGVYYFASSMVDGDYRNRGYGKEMARLAMARIDRESCPMFLTTWLGDHPYYPSPAGFWSRLGFQPAVIRSHEDLRNARELAAAVRIFQESHGISGRNYGVEYRTVGELRDYLRRSDIFPQHLGDTRIAVLREHYEPIGHNEGRWDGIIMTRNWEINRQDR